MFLLSPVGLSFSLTLFRTLFLGSASELWSSRLDNPTALCCSNTQLFTWHLSSSKTYDILAGVKHNWQLNTRTSHSFLHLWTDQASQTGMSHSVPDQPLLWEIWQCRVHASCCGPVWGHSPNLVESLVRNAAFCLLDTMRGLNVLCVTMLATLTRQIAGSLLSVHLMFGEPACLYFRNDLGWNSFVYSLTWLAVLHGGCETCLTGYQIPDNSSQRYIPSWNVVVHALPKAFFWLDMSRYKSRVFGCCKLDMTMGGFCFSLNALSTVLVMSCFLIFPRTSLRCVNCVQH